MLPDIKENGYFVLCVFFAIAIYGSAVRKIKIYYLIT